MVTLRDRHFGGFTIIELITVITIIGILATIGLISYSGYQIRAKKSSVESTGQQVKIKLGEYFTDKNQYPKAATGVGGVKEYLDSVNSQTLGTAFDSLVTGGATYAPTADSGVAGSCSGGNAAIACTKYTITLPITLWGGLSSDTPITITP
jgi:prepilin-type N-terminal cleavage/methylation domain-containing protein